MQLCPVAALWVQWCSRWTTYFFMWINCILYKTVIGEGASRPRGPDSSRVLCPARQTTFSPSEMGPQRQCGLPVGRKTWLESSPRGLDLRVTQPFNINYVLSTDYSRVNYVVELPVRDCTASHFYFLLTPSLSFFLFFLLSTVLSSLPPAPSCFDWAASRGTGMQAHTRRVNWRFAGTINLTRKRRK